MRKYVNPLISQIMKIVWTPMEHICKTVATLKFVLLVTLTNMVAYLVLLLHDVHMKKNSYAVSKRKIN